MAFLKMVSSDLDPYVEQNGIVAPLPNGAILFTSDHIQFARYGRGPGKRPPVDPIIEWLTNKGQIDPSEIRGVAFAISKSIGEKGTINYVDNAPNALQEAIIKHTGQYLMAMSYSITHEVDRDMQQMYEKVVPKTIIFNI